MVRFLVFMGLLMGAIPAFATPAEVLIIRHAEKPTGAEGIHLSARGQERAQALANFFLTDPRMTEFGIPIAVYAASPNKPTGSVRTIETIEPLTNKLGIETHKEFTSSEFAGLAKELLTNVAYNGKSVVVCLARAEIPDFTSELGVTSHPSDWSSEIYDRVWKVRFAGSTDVTFDNLPQHLLPGDSAQ